MLSSITTSCELEFLEKPHLAEELNFADLPYQPIDQEFLEIFVQVLTAR